MVQKSFAYALDSRALEAIPMTLKANKSRSFNKINFKDKFSKFSQHWQPKVVANLNDYEIKLVKLKGDFVWHQHEQTDEAFFVLRGAIQVEFEKSYGKPK